jgi:hypothetical protein
MSTGSKLIVAAAIVTLGLASAFAQSFNRTDGTGNTLPSYYDSQGGLHAVIPAPAAKRETKRQRLISVTAAQFRLDSSGRSS